MRARTYTWFHESDRVDGVAGVGSEKAVDRFGCFHRRGAPGGIDAGDRALTFRFVVRVFVFSLSLSSSSCEKWRSSVVDNHHRINFSDDYRKATIRILHLTVRVSDIENRQSVARDLLWCFQSLRTPQRNLQQRRQCTIILNCIILNQPQDTLVACIRSRVLKISLRFAYGCSICGYLICEKRYLRATNPVNAFVTKTNSSELSRKISRYTYSCTRRTFLRSSAGVQDIYEDISSRRRAILSIRFTLWPSTTSRP